MARRSGRKGAPGSCLRQARGQAPCRCGASGKPADEAGARQRQTLPLVCATQTGNPSSGRSSFAECGATGGRVNSGQILRSSSWSMHHIDLRRSPRPCHELPPAERFNLALKRSMPPATASCPDAPAVASANRVRDSISRNATPRRSRRRPPPPRPASTTA